MSTDQPSYVMRMPSKPESGDALFEISTRYIRISAASEPWLKCRQDDDPGVIWTFEFFKSEEIKAAYESSEQAAKWRPEVLSHVGGRPMRVPVHPYAADWLGGPTQHRADTGQPGHVFELHARAGHGVALFVAAAAYFARSAATEGWAISRVDGDPDTAWAYQLFRDEAARERDAEEYRAFELEASTDLIAPLAPIPVTVYSASWIG